MQPLSVLLFFVIEVIEAVITTTGAPLARLTWLDWQCIRAFQQLGSHHSIVPHRGLQISLSHILFLLFRLI
jgi:hypothetical protein